MSITGCHNASSNCNNEADDEFPSIEEFCRQSLEQRIPTEYQNSEESAVDTSENPLSLKQPRSDESTGNSQGTRGTSQSITGSKQFSDPIQTNQ